MTREVDVAIIGAGSAGLSALSEVRKGTDSYAFIDGGELGTTCARVGCMPSKALIQVAEDFHRRHLFKRKGIGGHDAVVLDQELALESVRDLRDLFVDKVLMSSTDEMGEEFVPANARFLAPDELELDNGERIKVRRGTVIATGSRPVVPADWQAFNEGGTRRVITTDEFFELEDLPESMAVVGLGVIGLELGQALHRMEVEVTGLDRLETIGGLQDPEVARAAIDIIGKEMPLWLGADVELAEAGNGRLIVTSGERQVEVDRVLASMGRRPNVDRLNLQALGVTLDAAGMPPRDPQSGRIGELPVFIAGDVSGHRPILHEANDEGRIAGYNAVRFGQGPVRRFRRKTPMAITFTHPNIANVGLRYNELPANGYEVGEVNFGPMGRALIKGKNKGLLRVYGASDDGRLLGAELCAPSGENLAHLLAWAIQLGLSAADLLRLPYYHPVMEEALQAAVRDLVYKLDLRDEGLRDLAFAD